MIVVDSSAVIAILFGEATAPDLVARLHGDLDRVMSAASYVETGTVLAGRKRTDRLSAIEELDSFLEEAGVVVAAVSADQARTALRGRIEHGRGMGTGGVLNFGDAFSYALAKERGAPLLFVGDDFGTTDVLIATSNR